MQEFKMLYWYWLVLGMILMLLELVAPSFTIFWFGLGALVVGVVMLLFADISFTAQILLWVVASVGFTVLWFKVLKPRMTDRTGAGVAREAVLGETGMVTRLPLGERRGEMRFSIPILGSDSWEFICDEDVNEGDKVMVREFSGNTMVVKRVTPAATDNS